MPLQDKMDEYKRGFEAKAPEAALAVMHRTTKDLTESGILARTRLAIRHRTLCSNTPVTKMYRWASSPNAAQWSFPSTGDADDPIA